MSGWSGPTADDTFPGGKKAADMSGQEIIDQARMYVSAWHASDWEGDAAYTWPEDMMPIVAEMFARGMIRVT